MTTTTFWILIALSTGGYNSGNLSQLDIEFPTKQSCEAVLSQIDIPWGAAKVSCIEVTL